jgi:uncharacterized membrane protein
MKCLQMTIIIQALQRHFVKIRYDKAMKKEKQTKRCCKYIYIHIYIVIMLMVLINYCYHAYIIYALCCSIK